MMSELTPTIVPNVTHHQSGYMQTQPKSVDASTAVIGAPGADEASKYYAFEFTSYDSGANVWAKYLGIFQ